MAKQKTTKNSCKIEIPKQKFYSQEFQKNISKYIAGYIDYLYKDGVLTVEFATKEQLNAFLYRESMNGK